MPKGLKQVSSLCSRSSMFGWEDHGHHGGLVLHFTGGERALTQGIGCRHRSESSRGTMAAVLPSVLTGGAMGQGAEGRGKQDWAAVLRWGLFFSGLLLRRGCARWNDRLLSFLLLFLLREWWVCQGPAFI